MTPRRRASRPHAPSRRRAASTALLVLAAGFALVAPAASRAQPPPLPRAQEQGVRLTLANGTSLWLTLERSRTARREFYVEGAACGSCVGNHVSLEFRAVAERGPVRGLEVHIDAANPHGTNLHGPAQRFETGASYPGRVSMTLSLADGSTASLDGALELDAGIASPPNTPVRITYLPLPGTNPPLRTFVATLTLPPTAPRR